MTGNADLISFSTLFGFSSLMSTLSTAIIVILAGLGCLMTERAGMMNIGLDGIITASAFVAGAVARLTGSWVWSLMAAASFGLLMGLFYALMVVHFHSDEFVIGVTMNIFLPALSVYLFGYDLKLEAGTAMRIPALVIGREGSVPVEISILVPVTLVLVAVCQIFLYRTRRGFWLRASGEHPDSLLSVGRSPVRMKVLASLLCGAFCGVAGAYLPSYVNSISKNVSASRGYVAVACVIFGRSNPVLVTLAALFFGLVSTVTKRLQTANLVNSTLAETFPYLGTILMMIVLAIRNELKKKRTARRHGPETAVTRGGEAG